MLIVLDGMNFAHRFRYMYGEQRTADGVRTGVLFGFMQAIINLVDEYAPSSIVVLWDSPRDRLWRTALYPDYKSGRGERIAAMTDEEREELKDFHARQVPLARTVMRKFGVPQLSVIGLEADDLAPVACGVAAPDDALIVSTDGDLVQLVGPRVRVLNPVSHAMYYAKPGEGGIHVSGARRDEEVAPSALVYLLRRVLAGDKGDSIPGVRGLGEVTARGIVADGGFATALFNRCAGDVNTIVQEMFGAYDAAGGKFRNKVRAGVDEFVAAGDARRNFNLMCLRFPFLVKTLAPKQVKRVKALRNFAREKLRLECAAMMPRRKALRPLDAHHMIHPLYFFARQYDLEWLSSPAGAERLCAALRSISPEPLCAAGVVT